MLENLSSFILLSIQFALVCSAEELRKKLDKQLDEYRNVLEMLTDASGSDEKETLNHATHHI